MRVLVQVSGGYDSAAALLWAVREHETKNVVGLFVDYGQPYAGQERRAAQYIAGFAEIELREATLTPRLPSVGDEFVGRNLMLASLAFCYAAPYGCEAVVLGNKSTNRTGGTHSYPDSCNAFFTEVEAAHAVGTNEKHRARLLRPLVGHSKAYVVATLHQAGVSLRRLWNCYAPTPDGNPCGACYQCKTLTKARMEVL